ncbi:MAG: class I SAM-dependent methyltransferase [Flavobacteriales bacterium]|nr:class I SAM-dependent methyltransferase [Flavobacteriales bacterium]
MASQEEMDFTYTYIDEIFRLSMGETGDYSGAMYNGDFSMTLEEAQEQKHKFIADSLNITKDSRVLDMCCGWGPFLNYLKTKRGVNGIGVTLSQGQADACVKNGFDVSVMDCRDITPQTFNGTFDAITCIGGMEHLCSVDDFVQGKQDERYAGIFKQIHSLLNPGGRFYMQTMVFSKNMVKFEDVSVDAPKGSNEYMMGLMVDQFPGSWLPYGYKQVEENAKPLFKLISESSGRLDYIETIGQWRKKFRKFGLRKYMVYGKLIPHYLTSREFRLRVATFRESPNRVCFEREVMDHHRLVFERID